MIVTTTSNIEGKQIKEYLGLVYGEVIFGMHLGKDFLASFSDIFGGRSKAYEGEMLKARVEAELELKQRAQDMGANAIVGVSVDHETMGSSNGMIMVVIKGTAVVCE